MKKKSSLIALAVLACFLVGLLSEVFIFNLKAISPSDNNKSEANIAYDTKNTDGFTTISLILNQKYVRKLIINYESSEKIDFSIKYTYQGLYGKSEEKTVEDIFDPAFSSAVTNIDQDVISLNMSYKNTDDLVIQQISIDNDFHFNFVRFISITLLSLAVFFLIFFYKDGFKTEKLHIYFAVLASLLGTTIIIAQPVAIVLSLDDQTHFERVTTWFGGEVHYNNGEYNLSDTGLGISSGRDSIDSIEEQQSQNNYLNTNSEYENTINKGYFTNYSRTPYLPMVIGYHGAKTLGLPFTVCFQIGKLFNLLVYVLLMAYAIKTTIVGKRLLTVLALVPTTIFLASNYSYDPGVFAGISVFFVHVVNLFVDKKSKFNFKTATIMIASISFACLAKAVYAPFILLTLLIPKDRFKNIKQSRFVKAGFLAITAMFLIFTILPSIAGSTVSDSRGGEEVSAKGQISAIVSHPVDYAVVMKNSAVDSFFTKLLGASALNNFSYMGKYDEASNFFFILVILIIFAALTDNAFNTLDKKQRWAIGGTVALTILLIWSALYLGFTPVASNQVNGVQSRYFLPLLFPLLLALQSSKIQNKITPKIYNSIIVSVSTITIIFAILNFIIIPYCL